MKATITYCRDKDAGVWIATSKDVPGLILEHEDKNILKNKVQEAVPELINENLRTEVAHTNGQADCEDILTLEETESSIDREYDL